MNKSESPQIRLHSGPNEADPIVGEVRFRAFTTSDITIRHTSRENSSPDGIEAISYDSYVEVTKKGALITDVHSFSFDFPSGDGILRETFEWRRSAGPEVKALATENVGKENSSCDDRGLKLVNVRTRELIAVFASRTHHRVADPMKIAGKLRFTARGKEDDEFEKMVVLSILSIIERGLAAFHSFSCHLTDKEN
ncbi:hypothetical protein N431DRAFT_469434 [Stipitochalara longipes BDJ]|nr:hypothetical protein N431DRAFT_469434 [Stipitochalara longipes BDJ]